MNMDLFLGEKRWEILKAISRKPSSPIEIAEKLGTTVSYISQQLKLIEVAGLVVKTRTGASLKGQPRNVYSLSNELVHLSILENGVGEKKTIYLTSHHKAIVNIWRVEDSSIHQSIEMLYHKLNEHLEKIDGIFIDNASSAKIFIVTSSKDIKQKIDSYSKVLNKKIEYSFIQTNHISKYFGSNAIILQDAKKIFENLNKEGTKGDKN